MPNYAWTTGKALPENESVFRDCNFAQMAPHTKIFEGRTGLVFKNCNLMNCDIPPDSVVEGGLRCHVSYCSHQHPRWVEKGLLECETLCKHLIDSDTITVDGLLIDTVYYYADKGGE